MGKFGRVVLCLAAVVGGSMVIAASASAEAPEFGRCVKQHGGIYSNSGCTETEAGVNKFEWEPGPGAKRGFTESLKPETTFVWELSGSWDKATCTGQSATGEYTGPKTVGHVKMVFTGCTKGSFVCPTLILSPLKGEVGIYELGETALTDKIGLKLMPEEGPGELVQFFCAAERPNSTHWEYVWRGGSMIVSLKSNHQYLKKTLRYRRICFEHMRHLARQVPTNFVGETPDPMEATSGFLEGELPRFYPMVWRMKTILQNEEKIEVNSVL